MILAMVLLLGVSVVLISLIGITSDNILNSHNVEAQRTSEYVLDSAATTQLALVRYDPSRCGTNAPTATTVTFGGQSIEVTCIYKSGSIRTVSLGICPGSNCVTPSLTVSAAFTDGPNCGWPVHSGKTAQCGQTQSIEAWIYAGNS